MITDQLATDFAPLLLKYPACSAILQSAEQQVRQTLAPPDAMATVGAPWIVDSGSEEMAQWDFGDSSATGQVLGYVQLHVFDAPGQYRMTVGSPDSNATSIQYVTVSADARPQVNINSEAELVEAVAAARVATNFCIAAGEYVLTNSISVRLNHLFSGSSAHLIRSGPAGGDIFTVDKAVSAQFLGLQFDSSGKSINAAAGKCGYNGITSQGGAVSVRHCDFSRLDFGINCLPGCLGTYSDFCTFDDTMYGCGIYIGGKNTAVTNGTFGNSAQEHNIRCSDVDADGITIVGNDCTNTPLNAKETVTIRGGSRVYAAFNKLHVGWLQIGHGWLNGKDGAVPSAFPVRHVVVENNIIDQGAWIQLNPCIDDVGIDSNTLTSIAADYVPIRCTPPFGTSPACSPTGIRITNNKRINQVKSTHGFVTFNGSLHADPSIGAVSQSGNVEA